MEVEKYEIVWALTPNGLSKDVNKRMAEGWKPTGGLASGPGGWGQAMLLPAR